MSDNLYYVIERMFDTGGATKDQVRYLYGGNIKWGSNENQALCFSKENAKKIVKKYRDTFRDYNAEYFIEESSPDRYNVSLDVLSGFNLTPERTNNIVNVSYDFVASFIVDLRHEPDYEIIDRSYLAINGDVNTDLYYGECLSNAELTDFLETEITGRLKTDKITSGIFRLVYAVTCHGEEYNTQDGVEYDSWETYKLLSKMEFSAKEAKYIFGKEDTVTLSLSEYYGLFDDEKDSM